MKAYSFKKIMEDFPMCLIKCSTGIKDSDLYVITDIQVSGLRDKEGRPRLHVTIERLEMEED